MTMIVSDGVDLDFSEGVIIWSSNLYIHIM